MASIIVTGGLGFVGAELTRQLVREDRHQVVVVDSQATGTLANLADDVAGKVRFLELDLAKEADVATLFAQVQPELIFHLAATHFIPLCNSNPELAVRSNVQTTVNLLAGVRRCASPPVIGYASTAAVYAPVTTATAERDIIGPTDIYGYTKAWGEDLMRWHHSEHGTPIAILRLFNVVGEGETNPHLVPSILSEARSGTSDTLRLGNLGTRRDYVYVQDVARAFRCAPTIAAENGLIYANVCTGTATSGADVIAEIGRLSGRSFTIETDPARVRTSDRPVLQGDPGQFEQLFGWRPMTSLSESLQGALERPFAASYLAQP